jgi:hypothetical protein
VAERQVTTLQGQAGELIGQLEALMQQDSTGDAERVAQKKKVGQMMAPGCVFAFLTIGALFVFPWAALVTAPFAVAFFVTAARRGKTLSVMEAQDMDHPRLEMVRSLLHALSPDLSPKKPVSLTLRHGDATKFGQTSGETREGNLFVGSYVSEYTDNWLTLAGRLTDGSVFRLMVTKNVKRKRKPKRKYSKITDRGREKVVLLVRLPSAAYPQLTAVPPELDAAKLAQRAGLTVSQCTLQNGSLRLAAVTGVHLKQTLRYSSPEHGIDNQVTTPKLISVFAYLFSGLSHHRAKT